jgi:hypothetical protein
MRKYGYTLKYPEKGILYITYNLVASGYYFFHKLLFKSINAVKALQDGTGAAAKAFRKEF